MEDLAKNLFIIGSSLLAIYVSRKAAKFSAEKNRRKAVGELAPNAENDARITARLAQLLYAVDADKAKIFRFHNGGLYYSGQAMKKFSLSYLQLKNGVAGPKPSDLRDLNSSLFPNMLTEMISKNHVLFWEVKNAPDAYLKSLHIAEGTSIVKCTALRDYRGEMLGFVSVNWIDKNVIFSDTQDDVILTFAQELGDLISHNNNN